MSGLRDLLAALKEAKETQINTKSDEIVFGMLERKDGED